MAGAEAWVIGVPPQEAQEEGREIELWHRTHSGETRLGKFTLDTQGMAGLVAALPTIRPLRIILRAPSNLLLEREVVLPLAAEREWANVLRYEMDRLTPFSENQVFWSGQIQHRDLGRAMLALRLSMVPKAKLLPYLQPLAAAGLSPAAIDFTGDRRLSIALAETSRISAPQRDPARILLYACGVLAIIALVLPFAAQSYRSAQVEREISRLQPEVQRAQALMQDRSAGAATMNVFKTARRQVGDPLVVLAAITQALPDDTFLTEITLNHLQLNIAGQSAAAAPLLAALSGYPVITDVAFTSPVTRDPTSHKDLFSVQAVVLQQ